IGTAMDACGNYVIMYVHLYAVQKLMDLLLIGGIKEMSKPKAIEWIETEKGCFEVISHVSNKQNRYPSFVRNGIRRQLSRYIYEECFGAIPEGHVVMHKCDNTKCINPEHLNVGTQSDNVRDMFNKGRYKRRKPWPKGEKSGRAKLTEEQVREIKKRLKNGET